MGISQMMEEDSRQTPIKVPKDEDFKTISELANRQLLLENNHEQRIVDTILACNPSVPELEDALRRKKEELSKLKEVDLPNAVESFGLSEFKLLDNSVVSIKEEVYAGITEENKKSAFEWLEATDNDGIIKNEVKCPFGKGQDAEAKQLVDLLAGQGFSFTNSRTIHPQTLKAFVKRQLEDGKPVPTDIFSIHIKKIAVIKTK